MLLQSSGRCGRAAAALAFIRRSQRAFDPALAVDIVGKRSLAGAMALNMAGMNLTRIVGPAAAGFLIGLVSIDGVYAINCALYGVGLLLLTPVRRLPPAAAARERSVGHDLVDGFRYLGENRLVLMLLVFGTLPMILTLPVNTLFVVFSTEVWKVGPEGLGLMSAVSGVGAVIGSLWVAGRSPQAGRQRLMVLASVSSAIALALFSASPRLGPALGVLFVASLCGSVFSVLNNTAIQLVIPDAVRGRVSSYLMMAMSVPILGVLPVAALAEKLGAPVAGAGSTSLAALVAAGVYLGSRELRRLDRRVDRALAHD